MISFDRRLRAATKGALIHLTCSLVVALGSAVLVLGMWYPYPYRDLSGGRELFFLIAGVDVVCGPLLTFVLLNPSKPMRELWTDLGLVAVVQLAALGFGIWMAWQARPLYLAMEVDRFKVVMSADIDHETLAQLPLKLQPLKMGVQIVALRPPKDVDEKNKVLFSAINGGRDYAERPEFYIPYEGDAALASLLKAKPLEPFFIKYPGAREEALGIALQQKGNLQEWKLLPVVGRQDWVALLNSKGQIQGFLRGDGF